MNNNIFPLKFNLNTPEEVQNYFFNQSKKEFIERNERRRVIYDKIFTLDELHIKKPKIKDYSSISTKTYIKYLVDLFDITQEKAISVLKNYNGDVYNAIVFYN